MRQPGFFESSLTCHPEARRAEETENIDLLGTIPGSFGPAGLRMTGRGRLRESDMTYILPLIRMTHANQGLNDLDLSRVAATLW
jgi:hypothetical protein